MRILRSLAVLVSAGALLGVGAVSAQAAPGDLSFSGRLEGATRYETAVAIARAAFPGGAAVVYVARGDIFADALAAGVLKDGPVVLTPSDQVNPAVAQYIQGSGAKKIVALGGPGVVSEQVLQGYAQSVGAQTGRIAGSTRLETSVEIGKMVFGEGGGQSIYFADGYGNDGKGSPDAVVAGALSDGIIVLTKQGKFAPSLVGGTRYCLGAACNHAALAGATPLKGSTRYETAAIIAKRAFPSGAKKVYVANGQTFVDAVAGGSLTDGPVLLVGRNGEGKDVVNQAIRELGASQVVALGGSDVVPDGVLGEKSSGASTVADSPVNGVFPAGSYVDLQKYPMRSVWIGGESEQELPPYALNTKYYVRESQLSMLRCDDRETYAGVRDGERVFEVVCSRWSQGYGMSAEEVRAYLNTTPEELEYAIASALVDKINEKIRKPLGLRPFQHTSREREAQDLLKRVDFVHGGDNHTDYPVAAVALHEVLPGPYIASGEVAAGNRVFSTKNFSKEGLVDQVAERTVDQWIASPGHYKHLTNPREGVEELMQVCGVKIDSGFSVGLYGTYKCITWESKEN